MRRKAKINGLEVDIVSEEEAENSTAVICMEDHGERYPWTDNVKTRCAGCGCAIVHRPYVPKKPPKLCLKCANALFGEEAKQ